MTIFDVDGQILPITERYASFIAYTYCNCLRIAENKYGRRDTNWMFSGFLFGDDGPQTRYTLGKSQKFISIELSKNAIGDIYRSTFQIAHETIHTLAPSIEGAPMIEEGVAVEFSYDRSNYPTSSFSDTYVSSLKTSYTRNYDEAHQLVQELESICKDSIKILRRKVVCFADLTPYTITRWCRGVPADLAERLCERRQMRDTIIGPAT